MQSLVWFIDIFNTTTLYLTTCTLAGRSFKYWEFYRHPLSTSLGFSLTGHPRGMKSSYIFKNQEQKLKFIGSYLITLLGNQILKGKIVFQESVARKWENKIITKKTQPINQPTNQQTKKTKNWQRQNFSRQRNTRCYFCTYRFSFVKNSF